MVVVVPPTGAVYIPAQFTFATLLPGVDQTSQRAKLIKTLRSFVGPTGYSRRCSDRFRLSKCCRWSAIMFMTGPAELKWSK